MLRNPRSLYCVLPLLLAALVAACVPSCSATPRQVAHVTVVSAGAGLARMHTAHARSYTEATDALRHSIVARGGTLAEYESAVRPIDDAFDGRSAALQALDEHLFGAAGCIDASRQGDPDAWRTCAALQLAAVTRDLESLREGDILPPLDVPPEVLSVLRALTALVGPATPTLTDGGSDE